MTSLSTAPAALIAEVRQLIAQARLRTAAAVNAELTWLYWQVGRRVHREILGSQRAGYGEEIVSALARQLTVDCGRGFSAKNMHHMVRFAQVFPEESTVSALRRQLSWTHLKSLIYLDDPLKRDFYIELCRLETWSSRQLQDRMQSLLYERSALSRKPDETIRHDLDALRHEQQPTPAVLLKDPYLLDFLGLNDRYLEKDLEDAILELYLRWLAKHEQEPGENLPLGIILCTGKKQEQIELLELDKSGIHVAEYLTVLPSQESLRETLHRSIANARQRLSDAKPELG
ncbi:MULTISPECIES: DUF1016 N-terminal domain-containing protein [unclassified Rhizobacter]|uniref:DUF1016 N-terminal domain-containing protein n=1 Tax=unclassified Rhizobacter TaxID=2640088 RepID=UPI0006F36EBF|nr:MULTISPECIES: DUF1016 N-terminal domain-containing protein [unclassified Rhizobacter]KQU74962.1 cytoplasmic protein [Rhizobacter sp. Root29]KQW00963.1 cytoplasmic protein [Rhizobacter sp. Root1238]KRB03813.1 cytoplasmic protein [Rhizobacter sp. Root16D2]